MEFEIEINIPKSQIKFKNMLNFLKRVTSPKIDVNAVILEIHNEFDSAGDILLAEAKEVLNGSFDVEKGERLKKLGFVKSKSAVDAETIIAIRKEKKQLAETVEYFRTFYPNNKFITEASVKSICEKYNLVFGDIGYYKGDVPEKNITEMEVFKLREEDMQDGFDLRYNGGERFLQDEFSQWGATGSPLDGIRGISQMEREMRWSRQMSMQNALAMQPQSYTAIPNGKKTKLPFKICAPESDFDMTHMVRSGHKIELHIPDPIVLQPVSGGYLVISKWGLEGQDESLTNEKMN